LHKKLRISVSILLTLLITIFSSFVVGVSSVAQASDVNLVLESLNYNNIIPKNFRKTSDLTIIKDNKNLKLNGLDKLNISGSQQFSENNLPLLIKAIGTSLPITVMDLRQESHGFINEFAVSWADARNNANVGLTKEQVLLDEANKLKSIKLNVPITFYNHPKQTIIPTKVQDEKELTQSKSLSYNRITVRDGGIPTDDMVDYFVESIKAQPQNSWLHFHCKQGIGRTSTFMIMYDMIKNHKEVSEKNIIERQLALANYNENTLKSFHNNERMSFLKSFYDYCKINGDSFNIKWSEWKKASATNSSVAFHAASTLNITSGYIKNPVIPTSLYVISQDLMTPSERTMVASLQGLVNGHCSSQIYTLNSSQPDYKIWLEDLKNNYKVSYKILSDPWQLLNIYKDYIDGYVLYSNKIPKDPSINNACSLASLNKAIVIDEAIESRIRHNGIIKIKGDCRNTDESWAYNNLWNKGLNHSTVIQLSPDKAAPLRDYAIMTKSLVFYEDSIDKTTLRDKIFSSMKDSSICLGWGPDEFINVSTASKYGASVVAADWSYNLTTLSAFPSLPITKKSSLTTSKEGNFHYVTFIMSDGDNQQWNIGTNYGSTKWYGYPNRDKLNLGWSMSPSLYYLAPTVFNLYYKSISSESANNNFIVSPSGNGYMYPSKFDRNKLNTYINTLNDYMQKVDEKYVAIIDDSAFNNIELWNKFTERSSIQGLFYLDYHRHDKFQGKILWSNNKPLVSCRDLLWNTLENEDDLVKKINDRVNSGQVNVCSPEAYTFVYVHVWSKDVSNVEEVVSKLKQNPNVKIVTPETFMELIKRNVKH
jgi:protein-tyrosine phosphatase